MRIDKIAGLTPIPNSPSEPGGYGLGEFCWTEWTFVNFGAGSGGAIPTMPLEPGGGDGGGSTSANAASSNCDKAAHGRLRRAYNKKEAALAREVFALDDNDLGELGVDTAICSAGLIAVALGKTASTFKAAAAACGTALAATVGGRIATFTVKVTALNVERMKKEYEMGCGEMGVIKGWLSGVF